MVFLIILLAIFGIFGLEPFFQAREIFQSRIYLYYFLCSLPAFALYLRLKRAKKKDFSKSKSVWLTGILLLLLPLGYAVLDSFYTYQSNYGPGFPEKIEQVGPNHNARYNDNTPDSFIRGKVLNYYIDGKIKFRGYFNGPIDYGMLGNPYGVHTWWGEKGQVLDQWEYKRGYPVDGVRTAFYENGNKKSILTYQRGGLSGPYSLWNEKGVLVETGSYATMDTPQNRRTYYDSGKPKSDEKGASYRPDCTSVYWYENGQKMRERTGSNNGENFITEWYPNGAMKSRSRYFNLAHKDGLETLWYPDGKKQAEHRYFFNHTFSEDRKDGLQVEWGENGKKTREEYYVKGERKMETSYWPNGKKKDYRLYSLPGKDGLPAGVYRVDEEFYENGRMMRREYYGKPNESYGKMDYYNAPRTTNEWWDSKGKPIQPKW